MYKKILMPLAFMCCGYIAGAQVSNKIDQAAKDPATKQRSEKADALLIDKKRILPESDSTKPATAPASSKKRRCVKSS
jgi:hypothetical protein